MIEYEIKAKLNNNSIITLSKDCECVTHDGPHWVYMDILDKSRWKESLDEAIKNKDISILYYKKENHPDLMRLATKKQNMISRNIVELIMPFSDNELEKYTKNYCKSFEYKESIGVLKKCSTCSGSGRDKNYIQEICKTCQGSKYLKAGE